MRDLETTVKLIQLTNPNRRASTPAIELALILTALFILLLVL